MARKKNQQLEEIYETIKKRIIKLKYLPEATLSINELAQEFKLSRPAVKEVLMNLAADSLVEVTATKFTVSSFTVTDIIELCQVREALECKGAELILLKGGLSDKQLEEIELINNDIQKCVKEKRFTDGFEKDDIFHCTIMNCSGNKTLITAFDEIRIRALRGRWMTLFNSDHNDTWDEHMKIITAFKKQDPCEVQEAIKYHILCAENDISNIFLNKDYEKALYVLHHMKENEK